MNKLPLTLDALGLAALLHKSEKTILRDVTRDKKHESQPPHIKAGKKPIWLTQVVIAWMEGRSSEPVTIKIEIGAVPSPSPTFFSPPPMRSIADDLMSAAGWQK